MTVIQFPRQCRQETNTRPGRRRGGNVFVFRMDNGHADGTEQRFCVMHETLGSKFLATAGCFDSATEANLFARARATRFGAVLVPFFEWGLSE